MHITVTIVNHVEQIFVLPFNEHLLFSYLSLAL